MNKITKRALAIGASAAVLTGTGVAFAVWTHVTQPADVTGTVSGNTNTLTLTTTGALPTTLGGTSNIHVFAANVTQKSQVLTSLTAALSGTGCSVGPAATSDFTVTPHLALTAVPAGSAPVDQGYFTVDMNNLASQNQDACQGSALTFSVTGG